MASTSLYLCLAVYLVLLLFSISSIPIRGYLVKHCCHLSCYRASIARKELDLKRMNAEFKHKLTTLMRCTYIAKVGMLLVSIGAKLFAITALEELFFLVSYKQSFSEVGLFIYTKEVRYDQTNSKSKAWA
jgi:hypothetical protein